MPWSNKDTFNKTPADVVDRCLSDLGSLRKMGREPMRTTLTMRGFKGDDWCKMIVILEDDITKMDLFGSEPAEWFSNLGASSLSALRSEQSKSVSDRSQKAAIEALVEVKKQLVIMDRLAKENSASVESTERHLKLHKGDMTMISEQLKLVLAKQTSHHEELEKLKGRVSEISLELSQFTVKFSDSMNNLSSVVRSLEMDIGNIKSNTKDIKEGQGEHTPIIKRLTQTLGFLSMDFNAVMIKLGLKSSEQTIGEVFIPSRAHKVV